MSRLPIQWLKTHINERTTYINNAGVTTHPAQFSRDCLEVHVAAPGGPELHLLVNHLKSQRPSLHDSLSTIRRRDQAERVAQIAAEYDLNNQNLAVIGDLNSANGDHSLDALILNPALHNIVEDLPDNDRWTYGGSKKEQIDYILVSQALSSVPRNVSIERRGFYTKGCAANGTCYPEVKTARAAASDHAAVVVEFQFP